MIEVAAAASPHVLECARQAVALMKSPGLAPFRGVTSLSALNRGPARGELRQRARHFLHLQQPENARFRVRGPG